jgi:NADH-quinone oxidoreductase subunit C
MINPSIEVISKMLKEKFGEQILSQTQEYDFPVFVISKEVVVPVMTFLYENDEFRFRFLTTMCGLHYPDAAEPFGMMYQLHSLEKNIRLRFKAFTTKDNLEYQTLTGLYATANWMEREAFDFYGITFKGHPNLKRILNVEDMDYFPMRKEYKVEDETRTDKNDTMFGRQGNEKVKV